MNLATGPWELYAAKYPKERDLVIGPLRNEAEIPSGRDSNFPLFRHFFSHPGLTRSCDPEKPVFKVRLSLDEKGEYYGWLHSDADEYFAGEVSMIFGHRMLAEMCFPYGSAAEEKRGRGKLMRFSLEVLEEIPR